ncbi:MULTISPECIES: PLP-dependent cysteine synthase family protein [unclassified Fusibacter]|uniref:PLP-dependent cysteine synthase family protein n=1 Tax=unclassified Fusibacter TaxID=2624464 RepID=UPI00101023C0|nr:MULTISPECIES: pyridoxal-phosphate dependent enzyme [unclassified Fusibacter]MCK8060389.1 pyridoxal-phosphate dependent enzyme [Fusibacter sp. A2]NPE20322.1 pyridoxal-phosphate dependent enzyme [Fusibacter sp. A1]RXV63528.1 pyridoxal-phosphate dependent enzyme [Fusibacter sp. A1]
MKIPVIGPTYEEMLHPSTIDADIRKMALKMAKEDPLHPVNLYNINWRNADDSYRYFILPPSFTGVDANIIVMYAKDFPSGSHKVGPTYSVLTEKTVSGEVDPTHHTLVWPSTGNYGVGGAWVSARMQYKSLVILPEEMSEERFEIIRRYGSDVIATPGCESNVKEIYDKTHELVAESPDTIRILNQFESFANYRFHEYVTGGTMVELVKDEKIGNEEIAAVVLTVGSAGTIASGDRIKKVFPKAKVVAGEPVQCPTLALNGYGGHDIQGIGDKHVTWIHNVMNTDGVVLIDDMDAKRLLKLFHSETGKAYLSRFIPEALIDKLSTCLGISGCANIIAAIKTAKYYDLKDGENVFTVATDGIDRYYSVMKNMPEYSEHEAKAVYERIIGYQSESDFYEGDKHNRLRWHNLKYYTWIEQQGKTIEELNRMKDQEFWLNEAGKVKEMDEKIIQYRTQHQEALKKVLGY